MRTSIEEQEERLARATAKVIRLQGEKQRLEENLERARTALHLKSAELMKARSLRNQLEEKLERARLPRIGRTG